MKQLPASALVLFALFFQGCQDNLNVPFFSVFLSI